MDDLDIKDLRLLQELDFDSSQTNVQLAKHIGVSPEVVNYRLERLKSSKILQGFYTLINVYPVGYWLYRIYLKLGPMSANEKKKLLEYLVHLPQAGQIALTGGEYDLIIGVVVKNNFSFQKILDSFIDLYGKYVISKDISGVCELWQYNKKFLKIEGEKNTVKEFHFYPTEKVIELDQKTSHLLNFLAGNGRATSTEVENAIGISRKTVAKRMSELEKQNIILGYRPVLSRNVLGLTYFRVLLKLTSTEQRALSDLLGYLKTHKAVTYAMRCTGRWDFEIELAARNIEEIYTTISDLQNTHPIISAATEIPIFQDLKYQFSLSSL